MTEQKLNLFELASSSVAEASAGTTKVMRRQVIYADPLGISRDPTTRFSSISLDSPKYQPLSHSGSTKLTVD